MIKIGIIGGSGLDDPEFFQQEKEETVMTPYGAPSSEIKSTGGMDSYGQYNPTSVDNPMMNPLHPENLQKDAGCMARYGHCHQMAVKYAQAVGGRVYTTIGREHSIAIDPAGNVYDFVLGIECMPIDRYTKIVPYQFSYNSSMTQVPGSQALNNSNI